MTLILKTPGIDGSAAAPAGGTTADPDPTTGPARPLRALVVADDVAGLTDLRCAVIELGLITVGQAATAESAAECAVRERPDVVLLVLPLAAGDAVGLAVGLQSAWACPVVVVGERVEPALIERCVDAGAGGHAARPVTAGGLLAAVGLAMRWFDAGQRLRQEVRQLQKANQDLALALENRKLIEKAKGVFMRRLNLDEAEAHRRLQQESQKRRLALVDLARKIIESEELFGGM